MPVEKTFRKFMCSKYGKIFKRSVTALSIITPFFDDKIKDVERLAYIDEMIESQIADRVAEEVAKQLSSMK